MKYKETKTKKNRKERLGAAGSDPERPRWTRDTPENAIERLHFFSVDYGGDC
jgi:hypothetical protein